MRSNNRPIYLIIKTVFLFLKSRSNIKITILILSTYLYLFSAFPDHLSFILMFLSDELRCKKISNFHILQILVYYYLLTSLHLKILINLLVLIGPTSLPLKKIKNSKFKFAVFLLLLI